MDGNLHGLLRADRELGAVLSGKIGFLADRDSFFLPDEFGGHEQVHIQVAVGVKISGVPVFRVALHPGARAAPE